MQKGRTSLFTALYLAATLIASPATGQRSKPPPTPEDIASHPNAKALNEVGRRLEILMALRAAELPPAWLSPATTQPANSASARSNIPGTPSVYIQTVGPDHFLVDLADRLTLSFGIELSNVSGRTAQLDIRSATPFEWSQVLPVYIDAANWDKSFIPPPGSQPDNPTAVATNLVEAPALAAQYWRFITQSRWTGTYVSFRHTFNTDKVILSLRVPYRDIELNDRIARTPKNAPDFRWEKLGTSTAGRPLWAFITGTAESQKKNPCVVVYSREHANEPDSSWAADGIIELLTSDTPEARQLRATTTFIIIPFMDPDGAHAGQYMRLTRWFDPPTAKTPEVMAYTTFFQKWADAGNRLDVVLALHNPAPGPYVHVNLPERLAYNGDTGPHAYDLHFASLRAITAAGFQARPSPWSFEGKELTRLQGWLFRSYGPTQITYEINSVAPTRHLSVWQVQDLGRAILRGHATWLASDMAKDLLVRVNSRREARSKVVIAPQDPKTELLTPLEAELKRGQ